MTYLYGDLSFDTIIPTGTGATARTLRARAADYIFAADFGVKADNTTNDTTAWTNAFTAATSTGKTVIAPAGVSLVSAVTLPAGVTLRGSSPPNSYFGGTVSTVSGSTLKKITGTTTSILTTSFSTLGNETRGCGVYDITILGDGTGTHHGISLADGDPFTIRNCTLIGCNGGIEGQSLAGGGGYPTVYIDLCQFSYNSVGVWDVGDARINNSGFAGNGNGIQFDTGASDNIISNCKIEFNSGNGVSCDTGEDNLITGNLFDSNAGGNLVFTNQSNGVIVGNLFRNLAGQITMTGPHIYLATNAKTVVVGNSTIMDGTGSPADSISGTATSQPTLLIMANALGGRQTANIATITGYVTTGNI